MKILKLLFLIVVILGFQKTQAQGVFPNDSIQLLKLCNGLSGNMGAPYTSIQGWNSALLLSNRQWQPSNPVSNWYGVTLVPDQSGFLRVSKIDLGNFTNPTGPTSGTPLVNNFSVLITQNITGLDSLKELHLDSSGLSGSMFNIWGSGSRLNYIDISGSSFTYTSSFFQAMIGITSGVEVVKARGAFNQIPLMPAPVLPTNSFSWKVFDIGNNNISGKIPDFGIYFPNLREGYFDNNRFDTLNIQTGTPLVRIDLSRNKLKDISYLENVLDRASSLEMFKANAALDTTLGTVVFSPSGTATASSANKLVEMRYNKIAGTFNLNYFPTGSSIRTLDLSHNLIDSVVLFSTLPHTQIQRFDLSHNRLGNEISSSLIDGYSIIEYLLLNNNNLHGILPLPRNGQTYTWSKLEELDLSQNPNIHGDLRLDWMLDEQVLFSPASLEALRISNNDFENVVLPTTSPLFDSLKQVKTENNRFQFDDLYNIVQTFNMPQIAASAVGVTVQQYIPRYWVTGGATMPYDTLGSFVYAPQDSAGIGGVRRRPQGDSVVFFTNVGYPQTVVHNVIWYRDSLSNVEIMGDAAASNTSGGFSTNNVVPTMTAPGGTVAPDNIVNMMKIVNIDSALHTRWFIRAETRHDSFPLLTIPVRPKKLIVGACFDSLGGVTICQQMVAQFRDTTSNEGKLRVRKEFGVDVIDSCVCGAIELWAFPDTLNQIEMEQLGTGTRTTSGQATTKAELLSADPNYALLGDTTGGTQRSPNFTTGSSEARPTLVAIIDSGVDYDNPNLRNRIWVKSRETDNDGIDDDSDCEIDNGWGWNYLDRNNITFDDHGHGTAVATVVGGYSSNNSTYNNSTSDALGIVPYKYTDKAGRGTVFHAACALRHAADYRETLNNGHVARVRVINTSWGYYGEPCIVLENAILYAGDLCDVLIVASAGNKGLNTEIDSARHWPSNSPFVKDTTVAYNDNVLAVGAFDANNEDVLASYSNFSPKHIDMLANGTTQTYVPGNYVNMVTKNGTSFSAPEVARAAGLLFQEFPNATAGAVKYALMMGVDTLQSADSLKIKSGGRLNYTKARQILSNIINPTLCDEDGFVVAVDAILSNTETPLAKVFPNPFSQNLSIEFDAQVFDMNEPIDIQIVDISGVSRFRQQIAPQYLHSLQLNELSSGLYVLSLTQGVKKQMLKVVKF